MTTIFDSPQYTAIVQEFMTTNITFTNPNDAALAQFTQALIGQPPTAIPSTEVELTNLYAMYSSYTSTALQLLSEMSVIFQYASPTDPSLTIDVLETLCVDVLLTDFSNTYLQAWMLEITNGQQANVRAQVAMFVTAQQQNLAYYQQLSTAANNTFAAWNLYSTGRQSYMNGLPVGQLAGLFSQLLSSMSGVFKIGTIGDSPTTEWKKSGGAS